MSDRLISSYIDIAANEYTTKYSFNRSFEKLVMNDQYLSSLNGGGSTGTTVDTKLAHAKTYNKFSTYNQGDYVFYKTSKSGSSFYVLSSCINNNTSAPVLQMNPVTKEMYVVNSSAWTILGIDSTEGEVLPKDQADEYINLTMSEFYSTHQFNTDLSAHPTKNLGFNSSSKLFRSFENISEDRSVFFYPSYLQSFVSDNAVYQGYMRKWDNGILEYDLTFRLGWSGVVENGIDIVSANNLLINHINNNSLYFKNDDDYRIFSQDGYGYVIANGQKQVNLISGVNAYAAQLRFIEPFKDLNYMVFTSNVKNIDSQSFDLKKNVILSYDKRLVIEGKMITGIAPDAVFKNPCQIPNDVVNIKQNALASIAGADPWPVVFDIDPWKSKLMNIDNRAFAQSQITSIVIPASTRLIGTGAFEGTTLDRVDVYLYKGAVSDQVRIGSDAFPISISSIYIHYKNPPTSSRSMFGSACNDEYALVQNIDLSTKMENLDYREYIGLNPAYNAASVYVVDDDAGGIPVYVQPKINYSAVRSMHQNDAYAAVDIDTFVALHTDNSKHTSNSTDITRLAASKPSIDINDVFLLDENNVITGYNSSGICSDVEFDLEYMASKPIAISAGALSGFCHLTSLTSDMALSQMSYESLPSSLQRLKVRVADDLQYQLSIGQTPGLSLMFIGQPESLAIHSQHLESLYIASVDERKCYTLPEQFIYAVGGIDDAKICGMSCISQHAFSCAHSISSLCIKSCGTYIGTHAFCNDENPSSSKADAMAIGEAHLDGGSFSIGHLAFDNVSFGSVSVDMSNSFVVGSSFNGAKAGCICFTNVADAVKITSNPSITTYGFSVNAFKGLSADVMQFTDLTLYDVLHTYLSPRIASYTKLNDQTMIYCNSTSKAFWREDTHEYISVDCNAFQIDNQHALTSIDASSISASGTLDIPYGVCSIDVQFDEYGLNSSLSTVCIPSSVRYIRKNAFANLSVVNSFNVEKGIDIEFLGENCVSGMTCVSSIVFAE